MKRRVTPNLFAEGEDIYSSEKYWKEQKKLGPGGRNKLLKSPEQLWDLACDFFQQCDETPWVKVDFRGRFAEKVEIPTSRPYTWGAFDEYLRAQIGLAKLEDYRANKPNEKGIRPYDEFSEVITRIGNIIRTQKLEGAIVGAYDARIVSAELGLSQKVTVEVPKQVFKINGQTIQLG